MLVHLTIHHSSEPNDPREFEELVLSAGGDPVDFLSGHRQAPDPKFFIGTGKLEELRTLVQTHGAQLVIFNHILSPSQERNIEAELQCRVLDRTGLILDIFAQRARTHEGKLQVELAQLEYTSTRLIRGWTHLERQKGGIGLRGPGETQLETDRRLLRHRIKTIHKRLEKVRKQRDQGRRARARAEIPTVSLVGYTNAGKSTLFNRITDAGVYVQDQLFATLDPTMRRIELGVNGSAILADTVGFISHLPHRLVEAFRSTLEEASNADLLLHVVDAVAEERMRNMEQVNVVLEEIAAHEIPQLIVYNKIDLIDDYPPRIDRDDQGKPIAVWLSAKTGNGVDLLLEAVAELVSEQVFHGTLRLAPKLGSIRAHLFEAGLIHNEKYCDDGSCEMSLSLPMVELMRILSAASLSLDDILVDEQDRSKSDQLVG